MGVENYFSSNHSAQNQISTVTQKQDTKWEFMTFLQLQTVSPNQLPLVWDQPDFLPKQQFHRQTHWQEVAEVCGRHWSFLPKCLRTQWQRYYNQVQLQGVCGSKQVSKKVYEVASGNHEMYIRRRRPDTLEVTFSKPRGSINWFSFQVQQMKSQKRDEEALRAKEKAALAKEAAARWDNSWNHFHFSIWDQNSFVLRECLPQGEGRAASRGDGGQVCRDGGEVEGEGGRPAGGSGQYQVILFFFFFFEKEIYWRPRPISGDYFIFF